MEIEIAIWVVLSMLVGVYANAKKKNGIVHACMSLILSPLLVALIVYFGAKPALSKSQKESILNPQKNSKKKKSKKSK